MLEGCNILFSIKALVKPYDLVTLIKLFLKLLITTKSPSNKKGFIERVINTQLLRVFY